MTITLHWWILPVAMVLVGLYCYLKDYGDYGAGGLGILGLSLMSGSIFVTIGHFL